MKGWISVKGVREDADRTLEEQMQGLGPALLEAHGKTVLDIGCAEGLIGREFAIAGAVDVLGIEKRDEHLEIARIACADQLQMRFQQALLQDWIPAHEPPEVFDIVLALGIIHKVKDPERALRWAARSCMDLLLLRPPAYEAGGKFRTKHWTHIICDAKSVLTSEGFYESRRISGAHREHVEYWRRK